MSIFIKKAAIYARVSTEKQEKEKTIESQLAELREICKRDCVEIVREYVDNGFSGATLARPALDRLRDDASKGLFEIVYIYSPDRLARKYVYQVLVLEELKQKGIKVKFLDKPVTDNPEDQLLLGIQGLIAEYERIKIIERLRRGKLHKARKGEIQGGLPPYGYDYIPKTKGKCAHYKVNEKEAEVVKLIFSLYLELRSIAKVIKELAKRKIKTRKGSSYWSKKTIHRILTNECYIGTTYFNKCDRREGKYRQRDKSEWIPIKVPRILDNETFKIAQEILKSNRGGKGKRVYILSSLMKCKYCGSKYVGLSTRNYKYFYYRCGNEQKRFPLPKNCNAKPVKAEKIEGAIVDKIKEAITNPQLLMGHILKLENRLSEKQQNFEIAKRKLELKRQNLEGKKSKLLSLYLEGVIMKSEYCKMREEIEHEEKEVENKLSELTEENQKIDKKSLINSLNYFSKLAKEKIEALSPLRMREFLRYLIDEIIFDSFKMEAKIIGHIPLIRDVPERLHRISEDRTSDTWNKKLRYYSKNYLKFELEVKV
jgi:site-specific DNA recombinase